MTKRSGDLDTRNYSVGLRKVGMSPWPNGQPESQEVVMEATLIAFTEGPRAIGRLAHSATRTRTLRRGQAAGGRLFLPWEFHLSLFCLRADEVEGVRCGVLDPMLQPANQRLFSLRSRRIGCEKWHPGRGEQFIRWSRGGWRGGLDPGRSTNATAVCSCLRQQCPQAIGTMPRATRPLTQGPI
jgi:hypothetical protein